MGTVGVQERAAYIYDGLASPVHDKARLTGNHCNRDSLQVFLGSKAQEFVYVRRIQDHSHTLLGLGDSNLGTVQAGILLRNLVQIDLQACRELTDRYRNTARTKVVALFNDLTDLRTAEHTLDLALSRSITLLDLCAADLNGSLGMYLGGAGSTANTVTAGTAA